MDYGHGTEDSCYDANAHTCPTWISHAWRFSNCCVGRRGKQGLKQKKTFQWLSASLICLGEFIAFLLGLPIWRHIYSCDSV